MAETSIPSRETTSGAAEHLDFSIVQEKDSMRALGIAVHYLMRQPSFASMRFGHWARTLVGQINRGHYAFVVRGKEVVGFVGWAMTSEQDAEAWLKARVEIDSGAATGGDCMIINAWQANSNEVNAFLFSQLRQAQHKPRLVYGKRYYPDGRWRPVRLEVNKLPSDNSTASRQS